MNGSAGENCNFLPALAIPICRGLSVGEQYEPICFQPQHQYSFNTYTERRTTGRDENGEIVVEIERNVCFFSLTMFLYVWHLGCPFEAMGRGCSGSFVSKLFRCRFCPNAICVRSFLDFLFLSLDLVLDVIACALVCGNPFKKAKNFPLNYLTFWCLVQNSSKIRISKPLIFCRIGNS